MCKYCERGGWDLDLDKSLINVGVLGSWSFELSIWAPGGDTHASITATLRDPQYCYDDDCFFLSRNIDFCPFCGRDLRAENEEADKIWDEECRRHMEEEKNG